MDAGGSNDCHVVDINKWAATLESMLEDVPRYMCVPAHSGRISRIPENLREVDVESYEPYFLSIGPYHRDKFRVQQIEKRKMFILKCLLEEKPNLTLKDYLKEVKSIEPAARTFYSDVEMESEAFVRMLLLDSLYILRAFCGKAKGQKDIHQMNRCRVDNAESNGRENTINQSIGTRDENVNTETRTMEDKPNDETRREQKMPRWFWTLLEHDLFLLENQLPFFVLEKVYALVYGGPSRQLLDAVKHKVYLLLSDYINLDPEKVISPTVEVHHLLHLCHMFFRPTLPNLTVTCQIPESGQMFRLGSAVQLYEAGVSFEARSYSTECCFLDITFGSSGKLVMPCLHFDDNTVSLLRNLIALEQMKYPSVGLHISAYAVLLLHLVTNPKDVKLLRKKGIIQHHLASDKEMMYVINQLSVGLSFDYVDDEYSLKPVFQELKWYTQRRVPGWGAYLKHRYFNNPWTAISLLAASLLLILTALQTYYAVYSYYHP